MRKNQGRKREDYKSETDLILTLMAQGKEIGMEPAEGTTYFYVKTQDGYKLESMVNSIDEIDIRYYWDTISTLLKKFQLMEWVKKKPPLTVLDKKQQSLLEWI
jgi:hypothetical protein